MSDVFISYARGSSVEAERVAGALRAMGYTVWRDDALPAHRAYADVIEERLRAAHAVVVLWSQAAVRSQWVRAEADLARREAKLVQGALDACALPLPFDQIQCADLADWGGASDHDGWRKLCASIGDLAGGPPAASSAPSSGTAAHRAASKPFVCVLPFINMSDDPEQAYFSDGITEDVIADLSKVAALSVAPRNTAFSFKGRAVAAPELARQLGVTHVLEGSVRRSGQRIRITAQLIEADGDRHIWAERYDRDVTDIFALQDEVSAAVVAA